MAAVDLTPSGGVVTLSTAQVADGDLVRVSATSNINSWSVPAGGEANALADGAGFLLQVTRQPGSTVSFNGLADVWLGPVPTIEETETLYFPMILSGSTWIADTGASQGSGSGGGGTYTTHQTLTDSGYVPIDASLGLLVDVNVTDDITSVALANMPERQEMSIWFIQDEAGDRAIDLGAEWQRKGEAFEWDVRSGAIHEVIAWKRSGILYYQNAGSVVATSAQIRLTGMKVTAQSPS